MLDALKSLVETHKLGAAVHAGWGDAASARAVFDAMKTGRSWLPPQSVAALRTAPNEALGPDAAHVISVCWKADELVLHPAGKEAWSWARYCAVFELPPARFWKLESELTPVERAALASKAEVVEIHQPYTLRFRIYDCPVCGECLDTPAKFGNHLVNKHGLDGAASRLRSRRSCAAVALGSNAKDAASRLLASLPRHAVVNPKEKASVERSDGPDGKAVTVAFVRYTMPPPPPEQTVEVMAESVGAAEAKVASFVPKGADIVATEVLVAGGAGASSGHARSEADARAAARAGLPEPCTVVDEQVEPARQGRVVVQALDAAAATAAAAAGMPAAARITVALLAPEEADYAALSEPAKLGEPLLVSGAAAASRELALQSAESRKPPGAVIDTVVSSVQRQSPLLVEAASPELAGAEARSRLPAGARVTATECRQAPRKGFLGFGRRPGTYEVQWEADQFEVRWRWPRFRADWETDCRVDIRYTQKAKLVVRFQDWG